MGSLVTAVSLTKALAIVKLMPPANNPSSMLDTNKVFNNLTSKALRGVTDLDMPSLYSIHGIDIHNTIMHAFKRGEITLIDAISLIKTFNNVVRNIANDNIGFPVLNETKFKNEIEKKYLDFVEYINKHINIDGKISAKDFAEAVKLKDKAKTEFRPHKIYAKVGKELTYNDILAWYSFLEKLTEEEIRKNDTVERDFRGDPVSITPIGRKVTGMMTHAGADARMIAQDITTQEQYEAFIDNIDALGLLKATTAHQVYLNSMDIGSIKLAVNSFSNFRDILNRLIKKEFSSVKSDPQYLKVTVKEEALSAIFNWGHTAVQLPNKAGRRLISPKLLDQLVIVSGRSADQMQAVDLDFQQQTGQIKTVIKISQGITKDERAVMELVIESSIFQAVAVQDKVYNQRFLGDQEKAYKLLDRAKSEPGFLGKLGFSSIGDLLLSMAKHRQSPSLLDKIENLIISSLSSKKPTNINITSKVLDKSVKKFKTYKLGKRGISKPISKTPKGGQSTAAFKPVFRKRSSSPLQPLNLANLQALMDRHLQDVVAANMGSGSDRRVLNYQTGRLASSAKVERLSASREGMITAFYSYMRNPYGTFSDGGQQQYPKSRDPKLLISSAIREIAATTVGNRMRAVLV